MGEGKNQKQKTQYIPCFSYCWGSAVLHFFYFSESETFTVKLTSYQDTQQSTGMFG